MARSRVEGVDDLKRALARAGALAIPALSAAMVEEQEKVIADAVELAPSDFGTLRGSGTVLPPEIGLHEVTVVAGFGGAAAPYVVAVHEHLSEYSPPSWQIAEGASQSVESGAFESQGGSGGVSFSPQGTGPKFLERPFLERAPRIYANLALGVRLALNRLRRP